jgi:AcrR family transcriptional regulator
LARGPDPALGQADDPGERVAGVRQAGKQVTRDRVLAAARELFDEIGYDDATIRMIAQRAGVSVGSVFTTFAGKSDILSQVMAERLDPLYAELDQVIPVLRGATVDRLRSIMAVHYSFETRRFRLFMAYIASSYVWSAGQRLIPPGRNARLRGMLRDTLLAGVERGEVRPGLDMELFIDTLLAAYFWNYRLIAYEGAAANKLTEIMDRQIGLLFDGASTR